MTTLLLVANAENPGWEQAKSERWYRDELALEILAVPYARASLFAQIETEMPGRAHALGPYLLMAESADVASPQRVSTIVENLRFQPGSKPYVAEFDRTVTYPGPLEPNPLAAMGLFVVMLNNGRPALDLQFDAWYNEIHLADVVAAGRFRVASRYIEACGGTAEARFLAIYEVSDGEDVLAAQIAATTASVNMRLWPYSNQFHVANYARVAEITS